MTSPEIIAHLANITFIFDHHERLGTTKNHGLVAEFQYWEGVLAKQLEKEHEARVRPDNVRAEATTKGDVSQPGLHRADREQGRRSTGD